MDKNIIDRFDGRYRFLSNYYNCFVIYHNIQYSNSEAAFHAQKDLSRSREFINLAPNAAKRLGRRVHLREDWDEVKDQIMYEIVYEKFLQHPKLAKKLLETKDRELIEGNDWGDQYWGVCDGIGENKLGQILMKVRKELRGDDHV